jgi:protein-S-isoprenylcysteine O-methyltransferase Ste14
MSITEITPALPASAPAGTDRAARRAMALDLAERLTVLALYGFLVLRLVGAYRSTGHFVNLLLLLSEGLVVVFILLRRPARTLSRRPGDWLLAFAATCFPLLAVPGIGSSPLVSPVVAVVVLLAGIFIQLSAKIILGRSFGCVAAHRGLKREGPYRFVRHPMYAGYLLTHLAFLAVNPIAWNLLVYALADGLQLPRLLAEERLLNEDPDYRAYAASVRYRLIPGLF